MKVSCTRRIQFCAGHRVFGHESKCGHLHGHNYVALFEAAPKIGLDSIGRVIDFSVLKNRIGEWIDRNWDHGLILFANDLEAIQAVGAIGCGKGIQKLYLLDANPTAENMASFLVNFVCPMLFEREPIRVVRVTLWETENCFATVEAKDVSSQ